MGFNEKVHACIAALFYVRLTEAFGERGRKAFVHGTQNYAEQRGRRMARRAIRDGRELTYATYLRYGEWMSTPEMIETEQSNKSTVEQWAPDYQVRIVRCPWHAQFAEMGLTEAGHEYCQHLDNSICRGFNPYLTYLVPQTLHKSDCCIHRVLNAGVSEGEDYAKDPAKCKPFSYHCGHSYWAYARAASAIFGAEGKAVAEKVLADFEEKYGKEMADELADYEATDFDAI